MITLMFNNVHKLDHTWYENFKNYILIHSKRVTSKRIIVFGHLDDCLYSL